MTAVPKPPDGYETWLDYCCVLTYSSDIARSELSALRSRLSAAEARAERMREALRKIADGAVDCPGCPSSSWAEEALSADAGKEARNA